MIASSINIKSKEWFFDTRATHHLSQTTTSLDNKQSYNGNDKVTIGNGRQFPILHTGTKIFQFPFKVFQLKRVLHAPHLATNLVSVSQFCADNNTFALSSFLSKNRLPRKFFSKVISNEDCINFLPILAPLQACSLASTTFHLQIPRLSFSILNLVILQHLS